MAKKQSLSGKKPSPPTKPAAKKTAATKAEALSPLAADAERMASAMAHNANKAAEYGPDAAIPPEGVHLPVTATDGGMTTNQGVSVADNQSSLKAGLRGPVLLKDFVLREKITHFDHERIPERIVHARGSGAHGYFECYAAIPELTRAAPFQDTGKQTPVFVRFSTVAGERGSKDTARDVRGFAVKFYTDQGIWDLVGNNIPVFFIQDAMKFPDLVHAVKPEPHHGMPQAASAHDTFWDFVSLMPESTHTLMWVMSDRGIPRSYRMMQGFGVHTFRFVNEAGEASLVKFHWKPLLGTHSLVWEEAVAISGCDPDYHRRDLWEAIDAGEYPEWELGVQVFSEEQADAWSFDVLDATKLVPEELVPVTPIGRMVLDRNPDNFFAETEQVAFCTAHVVPGIDFTNDPLLAGRIHSYVDTQLSRLGGPNFHELPVNAPLVPVQNNQRDGMHRQAIPRGRVAYEPNSLGGGCPFQTGSLGFMPFPEPVEQDELRGKPERFAEHYQQAQLFFDSQTPVEQAHLIAAFTFELSKVTVPAIRVRTLAMLRNVSETFAGAVAAGLGMTLPEPLPKAMADSAPPEVRVSPALSLRALPGDGGIRTRKVAIVIADGVDGVAVETLRTALRTEGATPRLLGLRIGPFTTEGGSVLEAEASLSSEPCVLFDGLILPGGSGDFATLGAHAPLAEAIREQHRHGKTILAMGSGVAVLSQAGLPGDSHNVGLLEYADAHGGAAAAFVQALGMHRHFEERVAETPE